MKFTFLNIVAFLSLYIQGVGQSNISFCKNNISYEVSGYYGKLIKIYDVFPESKSASAYDFRIGLNTTGKKYWHHLYNYPDLKLTLSYSEYGNKEVLGSSLSLYPSIGSKMYFGRKGEMDADIGIGLAFFNNPFDEFKNPTNNVIGSHLVAIAAIKLVYTVELSDYMEMNFGGSFRHYSDGHIKVPNIGANLYYATVGFKYAPKIDKSKCVHEEIAVNNKLKIRLNAGYGIHEIEGTVYPHGGPLYAIYQGTFSILKRPNFKHQYSLGFNYNYYQDYYDFIIDQQVFNDKKKLKSSKWILFAGHEWMFNHLAIETKIGVNLYYPFRKKLVQMEMIRDRFMDNYLSGQLGFNYYLFDTTKDSKFNPYSGISIRTIGGKADYVQLTMGVNI